jgi:hypothetical protein
MANVAHCKYGGRLASGGRYQSIGHLETIFPRVLLYHRECEVTHGFVQGNHAKVALQKEPANCSDFLLGTGPLIKLDYRYDGNSPIRLPFY